MNKPLNLTIRSRDGLMFHGEVSSLSSQNEKGSFDVLPLHLNFISLIYDRIVYRDKVTGVSHIIPITRAILKSNQNEVLIFVGM